MRYLALLVVLLISAIGVYAQDDTRPVTQDDVDLIASDMFCPVCENEPLDQCYNPTCIQWKNEIRERLAAGDSADEIIASFVDRYGQHVVAVPRDPVLRALSFTAPIVATILALVIGVMTFRSWQQNTPKTKVATQEQIASADRYRSQIERDLN